MFCKHCGKEIDGRAKICPYCGMPTKIDGTFCKYCGNEVGYKDRVCRRCGIPVNTDRVNKLGIIGFVLALISLEVILPVGASLLLSVVALIKKKDYGKCNGFAVAGLIISLVAIVLWGLVIFLLTEMWSTAYSTYPMRQETSVSAYLFN